MKFAQLPKIIDGRAGSFRREVWKLSLLKIAHCYFKLGPDRRKRPIPVRDNVTTIKAKKSESKVSIFDVLKTESFPIGNLGSACRDGSVMETGVSIEISPCIFALFVVPGFVFPVTNAELLNSPRSIVHGLEKAIRSRIVSTWGLVLKIHRTFSSGSFCLSCNAQVCVCNRL